MVCSISSAARASASKSAGASGGIGCGAIEAAIPVEAPGPSSLADAGASNLSVSASIPQLTPPMAGWLLSGLAELTAGSGQLTPAALLRPHSLLDAAAAGLRHIAAVGRAGLGAKMA
mmetsp:Transcript_72564/g.188315  ORF Transcript_72564/g.188315 Transcript_72564/m.188315 type:complete len:117 (+) Transcript_72564:232-582(+)